MSEKLKQICDLLPMIRELFDESVYLTVLNDRMVVQGFSVPRGVTPTLSVGQAMDDPTGATQEVLSTGRTRRNILPKEVYGAPYEGILTPITERNSVIGCLICTHSIESKEKNSEIAVNFRKDVMDIRGHVDNISGGMKDMSSLLSNISNITGQVEDDVRSATNIVNSITKNADTSHILAMNALIEAKRAGEAGKGFTVVANEMGTLANTSKQSAIEIKETLDVIVKHLMFIISAIKDADVLADANKEKVEKIKDTLEDTLMLAERLERNVNSGY